MTFASRVSMLMPLAATALLAACAGGEGGELRATLTGNACTYQGSTSPAAGRFAIEIENQTLQFASFGLVALNETDTIEDVELFHERLSARRLHRSRLLADGLPPLGSWVAGADLGPSTSTSLPVDARAGRYVMVCYVHRNSDARKSTGEFPPPERAYAAAVLGVVGTPSYPGVDNHD